MTLEELIENFQLFDDWEDRYRYLIDLGKNLPSMEDSEKTDMRLVRGCTSRVWMIPEIKNNQYFFSADSDAFIVRGLIAILMTAYNGVALDKIKDIDIDGAFEAMGLNTHLSPNRRNGFFSIVANIKAQAL